MRFLVLASLIVLLFPLSTGHRDGGNLVNAVLGNTPGVLANADETTRIRAHLLAVAERLTMADAHRLAPELQRARTRNIERLVQYANAGRFPHKPEGIPGRVPNFLDDDGARCAVGYLVEQDLGIDAVKEIAREHQFDYVPYIDSPVLAAWQAASGLSQRELAMIQPTYGGGGGSNSETDDGISGEDVLVITLLASDVVSSVVNLTYLTEKKGNRIWGGIGIFAGAFSMIHGQQQDDPNDALIAGGAVAAVLGALSFGIDVGQGDDSRVSVGPVARGLNFGARNIGIEARMRF